jgi:hypothetical protein
MSETAKPSRRLFLGVGPAAAVFGALGTAKAADVAASLPPTMQMLGVEFERLWAAERHAVAFGTEEDFDAASDAAQQIARRILELPAKTLDDFKVKASVYSWCFSYDDEIGEGPFEPHQDSFDVRALKSIIRDLLAAN